jgi:AraC-like DNA-binding protein/mannose-6-phosphate isomerase-like protein (cupin superfamily)
MFKNVKIKHIGNLLVNPSWKLKMHSHKSANELIIVIRGQEKILTDDGQETVISPGDAILFPKTRNHEEYNNTKSMLETIFLSFLGNVGNEFLVSYDTDSRLRFLAQEVYRLNHIKNPLIENLRQSYLKTILGEFFLLNQTADNDVLVTKIKEYIHRNLANPIRVDDLAKVAYMSKYYFIRKYKLLCGITPMEEVRQMRLKEAKNLLYATNMPLKQISEMTGFNDEYIFSKNFKRFFGSPPGSYRKGLPM